MTYALVEEVAASWESYEPFAVELEPPLPDGLILHAAGPTDEGFRIIEVWENEEAWRLFTQRIDRFADARLSVAPRYLRELRPTHLVVARHVTGTKQTRRG